ncbi:uncharacterized protein LOC109841662 [Asparagus officinalis]|uniref:uncharacterized protein LOC109841662 n=1 Tax=Asparagus officinalis TaxID=4686 RepID=UPI00098E56BE|nr:uncharacterized protein LOC109841662 [Asparagus officinalis]
MPYSLVYNYEAVLPLEVQISSLCVSLVTGMMTEDSHQWRLAELEALDEKWLEAQQHIEFYQARIAKSFEKKVKRRPFKEGELVLVVRRPMILNSKKKGSSPPSDGSYNNQSSHFRIPERFDYLDIIIPANDGVH